MSDLRQQYLTARRPVIATVDVPAWGSVKLRAVTQDEVERCNAAGDPTHAAFMGVVLMVCDDKGDPVFTESDIPELRKSTPLATVKAINEAALQAIGVSAEKVEQAKNG